jgi:tRNA_anti-like
VSKTCPSCGYKPIGPFTDNCPICAEPVRNVRSDSAGMGSAGTWLRVGVVLAVSLVLGGGGCCAVNMWRISSVIGDPQKMMEQAKAAMEADRKARTVVVTAADLLQEFQEDAAAADRKYKGKCLKLTGIVERAGKGGHGIPFVILHAGDDEAPVKVECFFIFFDEDAKARSQQLVKGETVTVHGDYSGRVSHIQMHTCVLLK